MVYYFKAKCNRYFRPAGNFVVLLKLLFANLYPIFMKMSVMHYQ